MKKKKQKLHTFYNFQTTIHHLECYNLLSLVSILSTHVHIQHIHIIHTHVYIYYIYIYTNIKTHLHHHFKISISYYILSYSIV